MTNSMDISVKSDPSVMPDSIPDPEHTRQQDAARAGLPSRYPGSASHNHNRSQSFEYGVLFEELQEFDDALRRGTLGSSFNYALSIITNDEDNCNDYDNNDDNSDNESEYLYDGGNDNDDLMDGYQQLPTTMAIMMGHYQPESKSKLRTR